MCYNLAMDFDEYQKIAAKCDCSQASLDPRTVGFLEKIMGLAGEAGEVTDKFKKIIRDKDGVISDEDKESIKKELGDVLWYLASLARYLEIPLSEVAEGNIKKLEDRMRRDVLHGEGDNR